MIQGHCRVFASLEQKVGEKRHFVLLGYVKVLIFWRRDNLAGSAGKILRHSGNRPHFDQHSEVFAQDLQANQVIPTSFAFGEQARRGYLTVSCAEHKEVKPFFLPCE